MRESLIACGVLAMLLLAAPPALALDAFADADLPAGFTIETTIEAKPEQVAAFGKKFGAILKKVTNQVVAVGAVRGQVNFLVCATEADADRAFEALRAMKGEAGAGTIGRRGNTLVEVTRANLLLAKRLLACAGALTDRPVTYEARFKAACVDELDYMQANGVFNLFLADLMADSSPEAASEIAALTKTWKLGKSLSLWTGRRPHFDAKFEVAPKAARTEPGDERTTFALAEPPVRLGIPFAEVLARITVRSAYAPLGGPKPDDSLTKPTPRWPSAAPEMRKLAESLTAGAKTDLDRVQAIVKHVFGTIKYEGPMGSRHGTRKVLEQGFGRCWDLSDVFVTLCRAAGIPARQLAGWVPPLSGGHVWAEVYIAGKGWLPVDPTTPWLGTSDDYVPWFSTSDGEMPVVYLTMPTLRRVE
jgi:hypothetical protein